MNARKKLNWVAITANLLLAALVGWLAESWLVFLIALIVLIGLGLRAGQIRLKKGKQ